MIKRIWDMLTVLVGISALATAVVVVRGEIIRPTSAIRPRVSEVKDWRRFAMSHKTAGSPDAAVTIVMFGDYQCNYCKRFSEYVDSLAEIGRPVRLVYRHLPSTGHSHALAAAVASECATEQGHFATMHKVLTSSIDSIGRVDWPWFARAAGVADLQSFALCMDRGKPFSEIEKDTLDARKLRIQGTPTILIESLRHDGIPPFDSLLKWVDEAAARRKADAK